MFLFFKLLKNSIVKCNECVLYLPAVFLVENRAKEEPENTSVLSNFKLFTDHHVLVLCLS